MQEAEKSGLEALRHLLKRTKRNCSSIAVVVVAEDPTEVDRKPALLATGFLERLQTQAEMSQLVSAYHRENVACRVVLGYQAFLKEAIAGTLFPAGATIRAVLDKTEGGGHRDGFGPARRSTGGLMCKLFGFHYLHANAYSAAISRHKHHQTMIMDYAKIPVPKTWSYTAERGWMNGQPEHGLKVICKSTYEAWSVGVSDRTVGAFDDKMQNEVNKLSEEIGQPVCVQEYVEGAEIYCLLLANGGIHSLGIAEAYSSSGTKEKGNYFEFADHCRPNEMRYRLPNLPEKVLSHIIDSAKKTVEILDMHGLLRIDFRVSDSGRIAVIDVADNPGTTPAGSLAHILNHAGYEEGDIALSALAVGLQDVELDYIGDQN